MRAGVRDARTGPWMNILLLPLYLTTLTPNGTSAINGVASFSGGWVTLTPNGGNADCYLNLSTGGRLKPFTTYTMLGRIQTYSGFRVGGTQSNSLWPYVDGSLRNYTRAPDVVGIYDLRCVFATQATVATPQLRLYSGATAPASWTNVSLVEGLYTGPAFDGTTLGCKWLGAANGSASVGYPSFT